MDDILILAPTKWKLRKAIRMLNQTFNELGLEQHPYQTLIGRSERGFDFLGYFLKPGILSVAKKTIKLFKQRIARLYEQGADIQRIRDYVKKWLQWVRGFGQDKIRVYSFKIDTLFLSKPLMHLVVFI